MAKKLLPGAQGTGKLTTQEDRQAPKRLTFDVTAEDHKAFKLEAAEAGMKMNDYFMHLWKMSR